jgi:hypothetical protein
MSRKHVATNSRCVRFPRHGQSLPPDQKATGRSPSLPACTHAPARYVDLKAEYPDFSLREIAEICYVQFDRRPSHNTVKQVLADGPAPSRTSRQYPRYAEIPDPAERGLAVIRLHATSDGV